MGEEGEKKRGRGRPKLPNGRKRVFPVKVRLAADEELILKRACRLASKTDTPTPLATFIRKAALQRAKYTLTKHGWEYDE